MRWIRSFRLGEWSHAGEGQWLHHNMNTLNDTKCILRNGRFVLYMFHHNSKTTYGTKEWKPIYKVAWYMAGTGKIKPSQRDLVSVAIHSFILFPHWECPSPSLGPLPVPASKSSKTWSGATPPWGHRHPLGFLSSMFSLSCHCNSVAHDITDHIPDPCPSSSRYRHAGER